MVLYVADTSMLLSVADLVRPDEYASVLGHLTDRVQEGILTWPDEVYWDLKILARDEWLCLWVKAVHTDRCEKSAAWKHVEWVMGKCPGLSDNDSELGGPVPVAAMARALFETGAEFCVASDDDIDKPTRDALIPTCELLGWNTCSAYDFIVAEGLGEALRVHPEP